MVFALHFSYVFFIIQVYTLWKHPNLLPSFTTHGELQKKFLGGADLMLPGVITENNPSSASLGELHPDVPCSVKAKGNK